LKQFALGFGIVLVLAGVIFGQTVQTALPTDPGMYFEAAGGLTTVPHAETVVSSRPAFVSFPQSKRRTQALTIKERLYVRAWTLATWLMPLHIDAAVMILIIVELRV